MPIRSPLSSRSAPAQLLPEPGAGYLSLPLDRRGDAQHRSSLLNTEPREVAQLPPRTVLWIQFGKPGERPSAREQLLQGRLVTLVPGADQGSDVPRREDRDDMPLTGGGDFRQGLSGPMPDGKHAPAAGQGTNGSVSRFLGLPCTQQGAIRNERLCVSPEAQLLRVGG